MPSASIMSVSVRRARSADKRARRETSRPKMAPTSPRQTRLTRSRKPLRCSAERPERPRSQSMTATRAAAQPRRAASSTSAYWRAVDSVCSRTCAIVDWRTYTIALRLRWWGLILFDALISGAQNGDQHVGQGCHQIGAGGHRSLVQLPTSQELEIDGRNRRQTRFDLRGQREVLADHFRQFGGNVNQAAM